MAVFSPRARILLYVLLAVAVFWSGSIKTDLILLSVVAVVAARVPLARLKRGLIPMLLFLLFTFVSNVFFYAGEVVHNIFGLAITDKGLREGGHLTLRLFILIIGAKVLTATTKAEDLVGGMSGLLGPIGRLGPVREFILTMTLTLRFLPIIYNEAFTLYREMIKESRGARLADRIRLSVALLTPLFERSLKKAKELADKEQGFGH